MASDKATNLIARPARAAAQLLRAPHASPTLAGCDPNPAVCEHRRFNRLSIGNACARFIQNKPHLMHIATLTAASMPHTTR